MVFIEEITTGTTGPNQSIVRITVVSQRRVSAFVSFLPEGDKQRPEVMSDEALDDADKAALGKWIDGRWPDNAFLQPPFYKVARKPRSGR